ncbi:hypothetical protein [Candidatus Hodarchaeum mangrovi]
MVKWSISKLFMISFGSLLLITGGLCLLKLLNDPLWPGYWFFFSLSLLIPGTIFFISGILYDPNYKKNEKIISQKQALDEVNARVIQIKTKGGF